MTQGYKLSTQNVKDAFVQGRLGLYTEIPAEAITRNEESFDRWLAAHDAQIRAEALTLTDEEFDVAARAAFDSRDDAYDLEEWEDADSDDRERYQCYVRPAFEAVAKFRKEQQQ
ncbi:hypothetical protein BPY_23070 [Bifidobacterium psychraerophilum]|uniref:hypothetical protein n=1 Tax=Bifidobacterium psychraerophilum TaxID=218140 RepID=UPI003116F1EF